MPSDTETKAAIQRTTLVYGAAMVAAVAVTFFVLRPIFVGISPESNDPTDPETFPTPEGGTIELVSPGLRAFEVRYQVDKATEYQDLVSDVDRQKIRQDLASPIHSGVTFKTQFHVFATRPSVSDLIAYIDSSILGPDLSVKASSAMQEHVWRQGSWVCETRFAIVEKTTGSDLVATSTAGGTTFKSTGYWIAAYDFHGAP